MSSVNERPLHVLQVVHGLEVGGTERVVRDLARHFSRDGFRTSVCCLDTLGPYGEDLRRDGLTVEVLGRRPGVDLGVAWRLSRLYGRLGIDLVHAHQYTPYFYAALACVLSPTRRVVFTEHGRHQPDRVRPKRVVWNRLLRPVTAEVTAVSEFTRESLVTFERIPRSHVRVIYNGVESNGYQGAPAAESSRPAARRALGLDPAAPVVLSVGRIDRVKDFGTLVRAVALAAGPLPGVTLLVAGDGDQAYLEELRALAASLGVAGRVRFLGTRSDVPALLAACDVFALTSLTEATSMTILEAMRAGRPVVATDVGGNRELVAEGVSGLLAPAGDAGRVGAALRRLLLDPQEARRLGDAGRAGVAARFGLAATFEAYRLVYQSGARRSGARR